jgi:hypothetical protein
MVEQAWMERIAEDCSVWASSGAAGGDGAGGEERSPVGGVRYSMVR